MESIACLHLARLSPTLSHLIFSVSHFNDEKRSSERFSNLPIVTQLVNGTARIGIQNSNSTSDLLSPATSWEDYEPVWKWIYLGKTGLKHPLGADAKLG